MSLNYNSEKAFFVESGATKENDPVLSDVFGAETSQNGADKSIVLSVTEEETETEEGNAENTSPDISELAEETYVISPAEDAPSVLDAEPEKDPEEPELSDPTVLDAPPAHKLYSDNARTALQNVRLGLR